jgi:anti-sigma regulatory factor (Ser/Thr protein kinase)
LANVSSIEVVSMTGIGKGSVVSQLDPDARAGRRRGGRAGLETVYPPLRAAAAQMRKALGAYLAGQALESGVAFEVVLAADEAFINAVGHAGGGGAPIGVSASVSATEASVEVRDGGRGFTYCRPDVRSTPDVRRPDGRGAFLMESMMDEVSVRSGRRGTSVRMVRHLAGWATTKRETTVR